VRLDQGAPVAYLITAGDATAADFERDKDRIVDSVESAVEDGVDLVQVREKRLPARLLLQLAAAVAGRVGARAKVLINERADVAIAAGAAGVHLPSNSLMPDAIRRFAPAGFIVGCSAHTAAEAREARAAGADFVTFGPVFATPRKPPPTGVEVLSEICSELSGFPVFGLGGIDAAVAGGVLDAGAAGVAAIRALNDAAERKALLAVLNSRR
jgi:thiamine-phosphate pyrophosphorylase